jgi:hypothetical protein
MGSSIRNNETVTVMAAEGHGGASGASPTGRTKKQYCLWQTVLVGRESVRRGVQVSLNNNLPLIEAKN